MIEFKTGGAEETEQICKNGGIGYSNDVKSYTAVQEGNVLGHIAFIPFGDKPSILFVESGSYTTTDGLVRCALNFMLMRGVKNAYCTCAVDDRILKNLGFEKNKGVWSVALSEDIFSCRHNCT